VPLYRAPLVDRLRVKNTSGATAAAKDCGYIDAAGEYKTTTSSRLFANWCVVLVGGADNGDIYVARRGRVVVKYTGTAPSAGHFLSLSTTAGQSQRETTIRPEIFAVCLAAGSGGVVEVLLLCNRCYMPWSSSSEIWRVDAGSDTLWTGTINGSPSATLVDTTTSTGALDCFKESASSGNSLCKPVLFNSTRSTSRLVTAVDTGTGEITTQNTSDAWASGDSLTIKSQTNTETISFGGQVFIDLDGSGSFDGLDVLATMYLFGTGLDSNFSGGVGLHPFEAYAGPKHQVFQPFTDAETYIGTVQVPLIGRKFTYCCDASGAAAATYLFRILGTLRASP